MSTLDIENLTVAFGNNIALNDVSFTVTPGQIFAIIGPNGAGKSTIFNAISRIYRPRQGRISFDGADILSMAPHQVVQTGIARTFQNIELFEKATVLDNLLVGRHARMASNLLSEFFFLPQARQRELDARHRVELVLDLLDMQHLRSERVADLPYGARKHVELARALCADPKLLLLDEPASGLNPEETSDMVFWLRDIKEELGITIIMIEHDMHLVSRASDRVMALANGEVITTGTSAEVQAHPRVQEAYLGAAE